MIVQVAAILVPSAETTIVTVPSLIAVTSPLSSTVAMVSSDDVQTSFAVEPSGAKSGIKSTVEPGATVFVGSANVMLSSFDSPVTVTLQESSPVVVLLFEYIVIRALIIADPADTPVTIPDLTVATSVLLLSHKIP